MLLRRMTGRIDYISDGMGCQGHEWFDITVQDDGQRTLRASCEIHDTRILRDVTYTLDAEWRPLDCFVRLSRNGRFAGSSWFRFHDEGADCEGYLADVGRITQSWSAPGRPTIFATHAAITAVWQVALYDHSSNQRVQTITNRVSPSTLPNGASGPMIGHGYSGIGRPGEIDLEYVADEDVEVPAGTFATRHYRALREQRASMDIWAGGPDLLPVKMRWSLVPRTYLLAEFKQHTFGDGG